MNDVPQIYRLILQVPTLEEAIPFTWVSKHSLRDNESASLSMSIFF
jgi:hypothetical protein